MAAITRDATEAFAGRLRGRDGMTCWNDISVRVQTSRQGSRALHTIRLCFRIVIEAFYRFNRDDGWAIASHIALSILMAVFPFLIVVTAIAGFIGSGQSRRRGRTADVRGMAQTGGRPDRQRDPQRADDHARRRPDARRGVRRLFRFEWHRKPAHRPQSRLRIAGRAQLLAAAAGIRSATCSSARSRFWRWRFWSCSGR